MTITKFKSRPPETRERCRTIRLGVRATMQMVVVVERTQNGKATRCFHCRVLMPGQPTKGIPFVIGNRSVVPFLFFRPRVFFFGVALMILTMSLLLLVPFSFSLIASFLSPWLPATPRACMSAEFIVLSGSLTVAVAWVVTDTGIFRSPRSICPPSSLPGAVLV